MMANITPANETRPEVMPMASPLDRGSLDFFCGTYASEPGLILG
jgi:hypothetical protein